MTSNFLRFQASILKRYPEELVMVFFYFFFVCILSAMVCLVVERDLSAWSLKSKTRLWCVLYSVIIASFFFFFKQIVRQSKNSVFFFIFYFTFTGSFWLCIPNRDKYMVYEQSRAGFCDDVQASRDRDFSFRRRCLLR